MKKLSIAALAVLPLLCRAQDSDDALYKKVELHLDHYISVQANELTKQILAVNNTSTANSTVNPFLVNYEVVDRKSQFGIRLGFGYAFTSSKSDQVYSSGTFTSTMKEGAMNLRLGAEKLIKISDRWQCGVGADFVVSSGKRQMKYEETSASYSVDSTSKTKLFGGGPSAMLRFGITKHIMLGTETSFYYLAGNTKTKTTSTGYPYYTDGDYKDKQQDARFYLPVTFYLTIKI